MNEWSLSANPAGFNFYRLNSISQVQLGADYSKENLKWAQAPGKTQEFYVNTTGLKKVGKLMFNGRFEYKNSRYNDLMYNNLLEFDNRNIYIMGDTINGRQKKEGFTMSGGASYPVTGRLLVGINLDYGVYQGAKMRDPRNLNKIVNLMVTPGLIYQLKDMYIGVSGGIIRSKNEVDIDVMLDSKHNLFQFLGLGYFQVERNISYYEALYENNGYSASVQLDIKKEKWTFFQSLGYTVLSNEVRKGTSYKLLDGITDLKRYEYSGYAIFRGRSLYHQINTNVSSEEIKGTEVEQHTVSVYNGYYYRDSIVTDRRVEDKHIIKDINGMVEYRLSKVGSSVPFKYHFTAGVNARYYKVDHYPVEDYGYYKTSTFLGYLSYQRWFHFTFADFAPTIGAKYRKAFTNEMDYNIIADKFFAEVPELDYQYLTSDYYMGEVDLTLLKPMPTNFIKEYFFNIKGSYMHIQDLPSGNNYNFMVHVSAGITF